MYTGFTGASQSFAGLFESIIETLSALFRLSNPIGPWIKAHDMNIYIEKLESYAKSRNTVSKIENYTVIDLAG